METKIKIVMLALMLAGCSSSGVPSNVNDTSSGAAATTTGSPLTLSTAGASSIYENGALQLYVLGGTLPYQFAATGGAVSTAYVYTAPATAGSYLITVTDALGVQASFTVTVVDPALASTVVTPNTTVTTTNTTTAATKIVYRFFNSVTMIHSFSDVAQDGQGGALEGPAYLVLVNQEAGSVPFYRCTLALPSGLAAFFDTADPACEGQPVSAVYQLGFVYASQSAAVGLQPLYRFSLVFALGGYGMLDHLEYPNNPYAPAPGWVPDQTPIGWVPVQ